MAKAYKLSIRYRNSAFADLTIIERKTKILYSFDFGYTVGTCAGSGHAFKKGDNIDEIKILFYNSAYAFFNSNLNSSYASREQIKTQKYMIEMFKPNIFGYASLNFKKTNLFFCEKCNHPFDKNCLNEISNFCLMCEYKKNKLLNKNTES